MDAAKATQRGCFAHVLRTGSGNDSRGLAQQFNSDHAQFHGGQGTARAHVLTTSIDGVIGGIFARTVLVGVTKHCGSRWAGTQST